MSLKDKFKAAADPARRARAEVTHLLPRDVFNGDRVFVVEMGSTVADELDESNFRVKRSKNGKAQQEFLWRGVRARYLVRTLCEESGQPIFDPQSETDLAILAGLGKATIDALYLAARRVNGEKEEAEADPFEGEPAG